MNNSEDFSRSEAVRWILYCAVSDPNWHNAVPRLTDAELDFCLQNIRTKSGRTALERELRRRERLARK